MSVNTFALPRVVTTLPEFKWLVDNLVEDKMEVISLLSGNEDPHFVDATPAFIFKLSKADLLIVNGLSLEIGWVPKVIQMAGNSGIQLQGKGYCDASLTIDKKQVVQNYDRSMGDVHPLGNPHYSISIPQMLSAAETIASCLSTTGKVKKSFIDKNLKGVKRKLNSLYRYGKEQLNKMSGKTVMTYHQEFLYFLSDYNITTAGTIEKVPGILPSANHLFKISKQAKKKKVSLVLAANTNPSKYLDKFSELTGIKYVKLPVHLTSEYPGYEEYYKDLILKLVQNVKTN